MKYGMEVYTRKRMKIGSVLPSEKHIAKLAKLPEPHAEYMPAKPATNNTKPMCIIIKYANAARSTCWRWASNRISKKEAMVINSHANRKEKPPLETTTNIIDATSTTNAV